MSCAGTICTGTHGTGKNYGIVATFVSFFSLFTLFNPFAPENFAGKRVWKLVKPFSGHCLAKKSQDLPQSCLQVTPFVALTDLCSFWYGLKDFFTLHIIVRWQCCPWPTKLMMSQVVEGTWICRGGYKQFRGKWVNWKVINIICVSQNLAELWRAGSYSTGKTFC